MTRSREPPCHGPSCKLDTIKEGAQCRVKLITCTFLAVVIAVGVQDDDTEPIGGDRSEDVGDVVNAIDVKLQFHRRINVCRIYFPSII